MTGRPDRNFHWDPGVGGVTVPVVFGHLLLRLPTSPPKLRTDRGEIKLLILR